MTDVYNLANTIQVLFEKYISFLPNSRQMVWLTKLAWPYYWPSSTSEYLIFVGCLIFAFLILSELIVTVRRNNKKKKTNQLTNKYVYSYDGDGEGPLFWRLKYPDAGGHYQSPVNIKHKDVIRKKVSSPLIWGDEYNLLPYCCVLHNDGHTVILTPQWNLSKAVLSGGPLKGTYELLDIRFHWGANNFEGSEHTVNFVRYALEVQAVHIKGAFASSFSVIQNCDALETRALLIISYLYQITDMDNPYLANFLEGLKLVRHCYSTTSITPFPLSWIIPPFYKDFYTYQGSLTCPPCYEGVKWIILPEPLSISNNQVKLFRKVMNIKGHPILSNCRPIQRTNRREIVFYNQ